MVEEIKSLKEEFEAFAKKVAALESIKQELDSLDVSGFEEEARAIRSNIRNIDAIPALTERLANLKVKIAHKNDKTPDNFSREVHEGRASKVLEGEIFRLNEKIEDLEAEIKNKNVDLEAIKEIPELHKELKDLREQLNNYISLSKNVSPPAYNTSNLSSLSQVSSQLVENLFVKKYNELLKNLNKKYEESVEKELREHFDVALEKHLSQEREKIIQTLTANLGAGKMNQDNYLKSTSSSDKGQDILSFLRVEKFQAGKSALFKAKEILNNFSRPLSRIKDIKSKEEQDFIIWERDISSLQSNMNEVSNKIYESVREN